MRQTAERALAEAVDVSAVQPYFVGNAPAGHVQLQDAASTLFFHRQAAVQELAGQQLHTAGQGRSGRGGGLTNDLCNGVVLVCNERWCRPVVCFELAAAHDRPLSAGASSSRVCLR